MNVEFNIKANYREQFCDGQGSCPLARSVSRLGNISSIKQARNICEMRGLRDDTAKFDPTYQSETPGDTFVGLCDRRLPRNSNYDSCGGVIVQRKDELVQYTPIPQRGESPLITQSRLITWVLFQLSPEERANFLKDETGLASPAVSVEAGNEAWQKAMIKIAESEEEVTVGLDLSHPGINWENFEWNDLKIGAKPGEKDSDLEISIRNETPFDKLVRITVQNLHLDEETETIATARARANSEMRGPIPLPTLVENHPVILMRIIEAEKKEPNATSPN